MNELNIVITRLTNAGLNVLGADSEFIYIEDPACIIRSFETFIGYAWLALAVVTVGMLAGWGIAMIRGSKNDIKNNFKNLFLIFGIVTAVGPILNMIYGGDLIGAACEKTKISMTTVNEILMAQSNSPGIDVASYEDINIYDSGPNWNVAVDVPIAPDLSAYEDSEYGTGTSMTSGATNTTSNNGINNNSASVEMVNGNLNIQIGATVPVSIKSNNAARSVTYIMADGTTEERSGGALAWRTNNPGAMRISDFAIRNGAIGEHRGMAVFANRESGRAAQIALLKTSTYQNRTLADAMKRYAPREDGNNPDSYAAYLARAIGVPLHTYLRDMTDAQLAKMADGIERKEGTRTGQITRTQGN